MITYPICNEADEDLFKKQCDAIEKHLSPLDKQDVLEDVDGSLIQLYKFNGNNIKVVNSMYLNEVYVESDIDIKPYFK